MLFVLFATTIIANISIINIAPQLSAAAQDTVQDPSQLSAQITQAQEDIRKELGEQGQIISNDIVLTQEPDNDPSPLASWSNSVAQTWLIPPFGQ